MFNELVKTVTIVCPECNTSVNFGIPKDDDGYTDMQHRISDFKCALCQAPLKTIAANMLNGIQTYNNAVTTLEIARKFTGSELS